MRPGAVAQSPGREAALARASLAQRFPASSVLARARRNINNLRYTYDTTLMAESEEELKSLLMKVKEEQPKCF